MSGGFAPVTHDGFGVGYSLFENELGLHITDFSGNAKVCPGLHGGWPEVAWLVWPVADGRSRHGKEIPRLIHFAGVAREH